MRPGYSITGLVVWLALCFLVAWFGSRFTVSDWYFQLDKPAWTPPGYVFGPVWTLLYTAMAVAAWLVWKKSGFSGARLALTLFFVQLVLNGLWSWIFFGMHKPGAAFVEILFLWAAILATTLAFWQQQPLAGILFAPYLLWVSFAAVLNGAIWWLNRTG